MGTNKIKIYLDANNPIEVNVETINEDERIDEALDSATLTFMSNEITTDIPPFTLVIIEPENKYYYCNSKCNSIVEMPGYYYHSVQLIEPLKILETLYIGSKSFSVIEGKSNYNKGFERLEVLNRLVLQEYGYTIVLSNYLKSKLINERSFSYGAGTTYFDIALDICKTNNCLPKVESVSLDGKTINLTCIAIGDLETNAIDQFNLYFNLSKNQNVDEYCENVVTEMSEVVDRNTSTTCVITPRSDSETITKDNAVLNLPTLCESVNYFYAWMQGKAGPTIKIPDSYLNLSSTYDKDVKTLSVNLMRWIDAYGANDSIKLMLKNYVAWVEGRTGKTSGYYDEAYLYYEKGNFCMLTLWNSSDYELEEGWVNLGIINKTQWDLLITDEQPYYIYYESKSNTISGFNNYKDNEIWNSIIWGEKGPYFKELYKLGTDEGYKRQLIYTDYDDLSKLYGDEHHTIQYVDDYFMLRWEGITHGGDSILDYRYKIVYTAIPHLGANIYKTIQPENELAWKKTTRSYNNGANTVDFNQLIPAMKRSANMLGLEITSVESLEDKPVGTRTQFGYIISKQTNYNFYQGEKVINNIVYNCCQNYEQIAAAIGVETQWEATNVPSNEVITRYVTINKRINAGTFDILLDDQYVAYLVINGPDGTMLSKACARVCIDDVMYLICETEDNYTFDYSKENSTVINYYKNNPVPYSDENQCWDNYKISLYLDTQTMTSTINSDYDKLPKWIFGNRVINSESIFVGKDARERLIFQYRLIKI